MDFSVPVSNLSAHQHEALEARLHETLTG